MIFVHIFPHWQPLWLTDWHLSTNTKWVPYTEQTAVVMVVIVWELDLQLPVQSVPITTKVVS